MPDIFLYGSAPSPNDVILSDPTVQRSAGGASNLTAAFVQKKQAVAGTLQEAFTLTTALAQKKQAFSASMIESFTLAAAWSQKKQAFAGSAQEILTLTGSFTQKAQTFSASMTGGGGPPTPAPVAPPVVLPVSQPNVLTGLVPGETYPWIPGWQVVIPQKAQVVRQAPVSPPGPLRKKIHPAHITSNLRGGRHGFSAGVKSSKPLQTASARGTFQQKKGRFRAAVEWYDMGDRDWSPW